MCKDVFDKELFLSLCDEYKVKFSTEYTKPMYQEDDGTLIEMVDFLQKICYNIYRKKGNE